MRIPEKICGIIGWPLGHSLSPLVHNWGFEQLGLPMAYTAFPCPPGRLAGVMTGVCALPVWGLSVTIPHKEAVMEFVDGLTDRARGVGAVNTLYWDGETLMGDNTDVLGFMAPLREARAVQTAVVLGAGGAARAAVYGLRELGVNNVLVAARRLEQAQSICADLGGEPIALETAPETGAELVVNTTPLGMSGPNQDRSPWPAGAWRPFMTAYDMVYNPLTTRFLTEAAGAGARTIDGLSMFIGQAEAQFAAWTGRTLPTGIRDVLLERLKK